MNTSVNNQLFKSKSCNFAAYRVKSRQYNRLRSIVNYKVDTRKSFYRANISSFASDNAPLHLIIRQRHNRNSCIRNMVGSAALYRSGNNIAGLCVRFLLCLILDTFYKYRRLMPCVLLNLSKDNCLCLVSRHFRNLFKLRHLKLFNTFDLLTNVVNLVEFHLELILFLFKNLRLFVDCVLLLLNSAFLPLELVSSFFYFFFKFVTFFMYFLFSFQKFFFLCIFSVL